MTAERIQPQPSGIDTLAKVQRLQDAGVPEQHAVAMLYAAIRASDAKFDDLRHENAREFAALRTDIDAKFAALDTRFEAIDAKFEALDAKFEAIERGLYTAVPNLRLSGLRRGLRLGHGRVEAARHSLG